MTTTQEIFRNGQVDLSAIPAASELKWHPLQPGYRNLLFLSAMLTAGVLIVAILMIAPFRIIPMQLLIAAFLLVVVLTMFQFLTIIMGFPRKGYTVRERDILYRTGWLYRRQIAVPFNRIQHVDIREGIIERAFGLARLSIYTAGGHSSDLSIPGLRNADALRLKEYILHETALIDEEE